MLSVRLPTIVDIQLLCSDQPSATVMPKLKANTEDATLPMPKKRLAFFVANTYENSPNLKELPGTLRSADLVETALEYHGFETVRHINKPFSEIQEALEVWRQESTKGEDPDALLFYFCGHGGRITENYYYHPI